MPGGRPNLYKPENAQIARQASMLGATNEDLAERLGVSPRTIDNWIAKIPDFGDAVRKGREVADGAVVSALFTRATGMERKATKVFCYKGRPITVDYIVHLPPDVRACIFWLRNRRPRQWRENRPLIDERDAFDFRELEEADRGAPLTDRDERPDTAPALGESEGALGVPAQVRSDARRQRPLAAAPGRPTRPIGRSLAGIAEIPSQAPGGNQRFAPVPIGMSLPEMPETPFGLHPVGETAKIRTGLSPP